MWTACQQASGEDKEGFSATIEAVKQQYAPDKRVAIFDIEAVREGGQWVLKGETNLPPAREELRSRLRQAGAAFEDRIALLPAAELGDSIFAVVNNSVANLRSAPKHSAELATQALLGTPLKVWKRSGDFYLVQTPDQYIAWVDHGGIVRMDEAGWKAFQQAGQLIYLKPFGFAYSRPAVDSPPVADLTAGNLLRITGSEARYAQVLFPDGRQGYVPQGEGQHYSEWLQQMNPTNELLIQTARHMLGVPYLWGGTSPKGVDCSGFTKTIYFLNGLVIPRDASQQVHTGVLVDEAGEWEKLQVGDLLFFGSPATADKKERVVHVGMWIGNNRFIHASGRVRISSVDPQDELYDAYNRKRYLRTKRILTDQNLSKEGIIDLKTQSLYAF